MNVAFMHQQIDFNITFYHTSSYLYNLILIIQMRTLYQNQLQIIDMGNIYEACCIQPSPSPSPNPQKEIKVEITPKRQQADNEPSIKQLTWNDFEPVRYLCKSQFGKVAIVKLKNSTKSKQYVMKIVEKSKIKQNNLLQDHTIQNFILSTDNPFIAKIFHISQNKMNIYIVMQYIPGRDLYYYLTEEEEQKRKFPEETIRQIAAETILGLEFLHSKGVIYRQLKPENVLCTTDGHIKLTDYVLSRLQKINEPTLTYLGNIQYTAPQMLSRNKGYNRFADLWSLGILLYELRFGKTPFHGNDSRQMQERIKLGKIQFPADVPISSELKNMILQLTQSQPQKRLKLEEVKKHPFFSCLNWEQVIQRKNNTGLLEIMSNYDLNIRGQNDNPPPRVYLKQSDRRQAEGPFIDFTCPTEESFRQQ